MIGVFAGDVSFEGDDSEIQDLETGESAADEQLMAQVDTDVELEKEDAAIEHEVLHTFLVFVSHSFRFLFCCMC